MNKVSLTFLSVMLDSTVVLPFNLKMIGAAKISFPPGCFHNVSPVPNITFSLSYLILAWLGTYQGCLNYIVLS